MNFLVGSLKTIPAAIVGARLAHIHGGVFTAWTVFFVCQTALVAAGRTELHRRIGWAGVVLGAGVLMLGTVSCPFILYVPVTQLEGQGWHHS